MKRRNFFSFEIIRFGIFLLPISFSDKKRTASDVVNFDYVITKGFVVPRDGFKALQQNYSSSRNKPRVLCLTSQCFREISNMTLSITRNKLFSPFRGLKSTTEQELAAVALKAIGNIVSVMSLLDLWKNERMKNNNNNYSVG